MSDVTWVSTTEAAELLGRSPQSLKRYRDINGGFLDLGTHYNIGPYNNTPITWDVEAVRKELNYRGMMRRLAG
jgi:hypothetical protein|tara:strand:- start:1937 stop:2155 length:219 start_codon:yes stop_codon:yes gene_type:complete